MNPFDSYAKSSHLMLFLGEIKRFLDKRNEDLVGYFHDLRIMIDADERKQLMLDVWSHFHKNDQ